jgi:hypothetical protein
MPRLATPGFLLGLRSLGLMLRLLRALRTPP